MHINSLPDLVLRLIFSKVHPLQDLLMVGRVCALWRSYLKENRSLALLIGSSSAQSLITKSCFTLKYRDLLLNDDDTQMYSSQYLPKRYHLTFGSFSLDCADKLLNIFPHIITLEIVITFFEGQIALSPAIVLLTQWSPILKSLKIYLKFNYSPIPRINLPKEAYEFVDLLDVINSMQTLEHLTLDTDISFRPFLRMSHRPYSIDLPILGRLHEFYFKSDDHINVIEKSLNCFAVPNVNLKQIGLECSSTAEELLLWCPQLANRIVYIPSGIPQYHLPPSTNTLRQFSSLTSLYFTQNVTTILSNLFNGALNMIAPLRHLTHLHYEVRNIEFFQTLVSRNQLLPLSSVQVLTISLIKKPISILETSLWAYLFPNVQVIQLLINHRILTEDCPFLLKQQLQETLSTFVECPKLHHLYTCEKDPSDYSGDVSAFEWIVQEGDHKMIIV